MVVEGMYYLIMALRGGFSTWAPYQNNAWLILNRKEIYNSESRSIGKYIVQFFCIAKYFLISKNKVGVIWVPSLVTCFCFNGGPMYYVCTVFGKTRGIA